MKILCPGVTWDGLTASVARAAATESPTVKKNKENGTACAQQPNRPRVAVGRVLANPSFLDG